MARIVLVGPRPGARGGIAQFTGHLYRALEGHADVRWLSFARLYPGWTAAGRNESVTDPAGSPADEAALIAWRRSSWRSAETRLHELAPDRVVLQWWHPVFGPALAAVARAARRSGARIEFVCHNAAPHERFPFAERLMRRTLREADRLVALSESTAGELRARVPSTPVEVREHPPFAYAPSTAAVERWVERAGDRPLVTFFGYVRPYKGLADLIAAMPIVRRVHPGAGLLVAGPFLEDPARYARAARQAGVADAVHLVPGYVPDEEVGGILAISDVVALPYRSASQSGVLPQALAAGVPVVATDVGGLAEALGSRGEVVRPRDPESLAAGILLALSRGRPPARPAAPAPDAWGAWRELFLVPARPVAA